MRPNHRQMQGCDAFTPRGGTCQVQCLLFLMEARWQVGQGEERSENVPERVQLSIAQSPMRRPGLCPLPGVQLQHGGPDAGLPCARRRRGLATGGLPLFSSSTTTTSILIILLERGGSCVSLEVSTIDNVIKVVAGHFKTK